jgi:hypothetical protein
MNYTTSQTNNCYKSGSCPKGGVKIRETNYSNQTNQSKQLNPRNYEQEQVIMSQMNAPSTVKTPVNYYNTTLNDLDLDLDHYSLEDLYRLFNIPGQLNDQTLKEAKNIVYKIHPDKSRLDPKYFRFFSNAYKRIYGIYEFQNKSTSKRMVEEEYYEDSNRTVLDNMFDSNKTLRDPKNFNSWFNEKFEKHNQENDENSKGYGDWLKSDQGIYTVNDNITKSNMNEAFERQKKQIQSLTVYNGISDSFSSFSGSLLGDQSENFTGSNGGLGFTDLRQAHVESVIPVTLEDYERMPKYRNVNDYKARRDGTDITPLSKQEAERMLIEQGQNLERESAALAYKYAQQLERSKQHNQSFFSDIKQIKG